MRITVVSDVHANLAAVEAILQRAEQHQALDQIWSMGDLVGYGPRPSECLALLRGYPFVSVTGNHDAAAVGKMDTSEFNPAAAEANAWTAGRLTETDISYLRDLPETVTNAGITLVHGSLRSPLWEYIFTQDIAAGHFRRQQTDYGFFGHTHLPMVFEEVPGRARPIIYPLSDGDVIELGARRLIMNPGGAGQPRDGDPRTAFAIYDTDDRTVSFYRIPYDIERTQREMSEVRLPERLIHRLSLGR